MNSNRRIYLTYGLAFGLALTVLGIIFRLVNVSVASPLVLAFYLVLPLAAWLAIRRSRQGSAEGTFRSEMLLASYATLLAAGLYSLSVLAYNVLIDATWLQAVEELARTRAVDSGKTGAALDAAYRQASVLSRPFPFTVVVFMQLAFAGILSSAVIAGSAAMKRRLASD